MTSEDTLLPAHVPQNDRWIVEATLALYYDINVLKNLHTFALEILYRAIFEQPNMPTTNK
ncbi:hypothetical protein [Listeria booriae]|uniref:Uncharacterized protein n=1 Tax=Listeria booriae TaxID=1552123 RepID=A0A7X1CB76_9LIST|nr:hypothetical protein [Listeria booriae]MBC1490952.1 hypothetical protein [Listeria booriae]MBC1491133.1 hypothetical protein [Listeria booriae]MBC2178166.1 hypothetical protein [Listeria booriae]MBC2178307.1 hypothetical protein [Listeria booriae]MBC2258898.1 hypothetical protein [Listeria booriae]